MKIHGTCKIYTRKEMDVDPDRGTKFARFVCCIKNADPEIAVAWKKVLRCDAFCTSLVDACTLPGGVPGLGTVERRTPPACCYLFLFTGLNT